MKKVVYVVLIILILLLTVGCGPADTEPPNWQKIDDKFVMQEDFSKYVHYADTESLIFSIENKNEDISFYFRPSTTTKTLVEYDLTERAIRRVYPIETEAQVKDAVPIDGGIIYVDYDDEESRKNHVDDEIIGIDWQIIRADEDKTEVISEGKCGDYGILPELEVVDGEVVALWCDMDKDCSTLSKITGDGLENIVQEKYGWLENTSLQSNTKEVCFTLKVSNDHSEVAVADLAGTVTTYEMNGRLLACGLSRDNLICNIGHENNQKFELLNYNIRTQEEKKDKIYEALYRMEGGDSDYVVCTLSNYGIKKINCKDSQIDTVDTPPELMYKSVYFDGLTDNKVIAAVLIDNDYLIYEGYLY